MSKRQHHELENDAESGLTPAKRFTPLDAGESDSLASEKLEDLSSYLGLKDLSAEDGPKSLISTPFVGTLPNPLLAFIGIQLTN